MIEECVVNVPAWLTALVEEVIKDAVVAHTVIGPLGYRWLLPGDAGNEFEGWQVTVYPTPGEIRGAHPNDGDKFVSGFRLNVGSILNHLTDVEEVAWNAPSHYNGDLDGPEFDVRGKFIGKRVWIRFFSLPPFDEPSTCYLDPRTGRAWTKSA